MRTFNPCGRFRLCRRFLSISARWAARSSRSLRKPASVLGLATGSTPLGTYRELTALAQSGEIDFSRATTFNLDEYVGLAPDHPMSYRAYMREHLFGQIEVGKTHVPDGRAADIAQHCAEYEDAIRRALDRLFTGF